MEQVYYCLVFEHDYRLVLVAAAICLFGSATTFVMVDRAREARHRAKWLALLALCSGATVWSTHFVAMLAFEQGLTMSYALYATLGSLLAGIVGIGGGFAIALPRAGREWTAIMAGLVAGTGVIVLHYVGMSAVRLPGRIAYDPDLVITSVAFSLLFGGLSFYFAFARDGRRNRALALTCFVLMVVLLHFTAMGAVRIEPGPWLGDATPELSRETLATLIAATTIALLAVGLAGALFDRRHSRELFALAQRFRVLSDSALEGLVIHREGAVLDSNAAARRLLALDGGPEPESIYSWFGGAPRAQVGQWLAQTADAPAEVALAGRDGRTFTAEVCGSTLQLPDGSPGQVLAIRDVTARKEAEARLEHQALHDPLTDLPNRRLFVELADKVRAQAARHGGRFAVFMLDLDNFKTVNDLHGHGGGDRLLVELARRIQADLRDSDIVARFGGDEFALVATAPEQPQDSIVLAERLLRNISRPVHLDGSEVVVSPSVGIALYPGDGQSIEELVRNADTAMYDAKSDGKGTFKFFEPGMNRALEARHAMEKGLRQAIADERLTVAYQPVIHARTRATVGFEALVRWDDEILGQVSPAHFIPVAEETGLIVPLGEYVLRTACRAAAAWETPVRVAVNLSAIQFRRAGLAETVERILEETGLPGSRLDLEITESILIDNRKQVLETLHALKALGVRISMDDFGTGFSSLRYLQSFPFDKIKIDRGFIMGLDANPQSLSIVRAVVAMGHSLGMKVVAEGVETDVQAERLRDMDCDELQGYLIAKPMSHDLVEDFLAERRRIA